MKKLNHTPGPWEADQDQEHSFLIVSTGKTIAMTNETEVEEGNMTIKEVKANAKLMAAGPELLEALKNLLEFAMDYGISERASHLDWSGHFAQAEAAIKKATK